MSLIIDLLRSLGAGESIVVAAVLGFAAWYLIKTLKVGKAIGSLFGSAVGYTVAGLIIIAVGVGAGWLDPEPSVFIDGVSSLARGIWDAIGGFVVELIEGVVP